MIIITLIPILYIPCKDNKIKTLRISWFFFFLLPFPLSLPPPRVCASFSSSVLPSVSDDTVQL